MIRFRQFEQITFHRLVFVGCQPQGWHDEDGLDRLADERREHQLLRRPVGEILETKATVENFPGNVVVHQDPSAGEEVDVGVLLGQAEAARAHLDHLPGEHGHRFGHKAWNHRRVKLRRIHAQKIAGFQEQ